MSLVTNWLNLTDMPAFEVTRLVPSTDPISLREMELRFAAQQAEPDKDYHLSDPCPCCGAFNMTAQDWMHLGVCFPCYDRETKF